MTAGIEPRAEPKGASPRLILASASPSRRRMLENAGLEFRTQAAAVDEDEIKASLKAEDASALEVAESLAELKAQRISRRDETAMVIGADQILVCGEVWFDKPPDLTHAAGHLRALAGKTHILATCVCVVQDGRRLWHHRDQPRLTMRPFGDAFIEEYLVAAGEAVLSSVGAYQLEGRGAQLFSRIEGDFFSILGLPLLPLLDFLRQHRIVAS